MSFEILKKQHGHYGPRLVGSVRAHKSGRAKQVKFSISDDIAETLGLENGSKVDVFIGKNMDASKIAIRKSTNGSGYSLYHPSKGSKALAFGFSGERSGLSQPQCSTKIEWNIDGGTLILDCAPLCK